MKRRTLLLTLGVLALGGIAFWLYANASLPRLREEFLPWMRRLGTWRDGIEGVSGALRRSKPAASDPAGIEDLRQWAWDGLDRIAFVSYRVEKPEHEISAGRERTWGRVRFAVDGFRTDGARVERAADTVVTVEDDVGEAHPSPRPRLRGSYGGQASPKGRGGGVSVSFERAVSERSESSPRFRNSTAEAGLGAPRNDPPLPLTNRLIAGIWPGSGVAVLDFDQDEDEDLFVGDGLRSTLYENDGKGRFTDVTETAGLAYSARQGIAATGVAAGDVDGDGFPDLLITDSFGPARLFQNRGDGSFEEITERSGINAPRDTRSAAFADIDGDGDLDLFLCVTGDYYWQMPDPPYDANDAAENHLYVNDGTGRFTDATAAWGISGARRWSLSCLFTDYDGDGDADLLVTNDFGFKNLYRNEKGKRFVDVAREIGVEDRAYGMSAAWGDFDGDGRLDLYTTGCDTQWYFLHEYPGLPIPFPGRLFLSTAVSWMEKMTRGNSLLLQRPPGAFENVTALSGATQAGWNWSVAAADLDNDSWPDLYTANGMWGDGRERDRELEFWWESLAYWKDYVAGTRTFDRQGAGIQGMERDRYFRNRGGLSPGRPLFEERAFLEGLDLETNGRAVVAFDANADGALDLYIRSVQAPEALFLGTRRPEEHFLRLRLSGSPGRDNRDGVGARITATLPNGRRLLLETGNASGYLSTASPIAHLGLGAATRLAGLTIRWPSGRIQSLGAIERVDRLLVVDQERGVVPPDGAALPQ